MPADEWVGLFVISYKLWETPQFYIIGAFLLSVDVSRTE